MIWRLLHIVVLAALVLAAADVYKIKYESTLQAERVARLRAEVRREQHDEQDPPHQVDERQWTEGAGPEPAQKQHDVGDVCEQEETQPDEEAELVR